MLSLRLSRGPCAAMLPLLTLPLLLTAAVARAEASNALPEPQALSQLLASHTVQGVAELEVIAFPAQGPTGEPIPPKHRLLIQGGLHGNEEQTTQFVLWLARRFARGDSPLNALAREQALAIDFLPRANPDGDQARSRANSHGVNLNRNFPVLWGLSRENPGPASFSEPETRAIRRLFQHRHYTAAVDVHGYVNWIVAPSEGAALEARGLPVNAAAKTAYAGWRQALSDAMRLLPGYQLRTGASLGDGGAFEDWAYWSQGAFAYCLEMETFQRFVPTYRPDFSAFGANGDGTTPARVDLFQRYERFIYVTFARAVALHGSAATLAEGEDQHRRDGARGSH